MKHSFAFCSTSSITTGSNLKSSPSLPVIQTQARDELMSGIPT